VSFICPLGMFTVTVNTVPGMVFPIKALSNGSMIQFGIPNLYFCLFNSLTGDITTSNRGGIDRFSGIVIVTSRGSSFFTITAETTATVTDPQSYLGGPVDFYPYACIESGIRYINDSYSGKILEIKSDDSTIPIPEYTGGAVLAVAIGPGGSAQGVDNDYDWNYGGGGGGLAWGVIDASLYNYELPIQVSGPLSSGGGEVGTNFSVATIVGKRDGNLPYILGHAGNSPDRRRNNDKYPGAGGGLKVAFGDAVVDGRSVATNKSCRFLRGQERHTLHGWGVQGVPFYANTGRGLDVNQGSEVPRRNPLFLARSCRQDFVSSTKRRSPKLSSR
jgi:hypothetical protein